MIITLKWCECQQAVAVGAQRRLRAMANGRAPRYGYNANDVWGTDIEGAGAEMAAAKALNRFWSDKGTLDYAGDLADGEQVRHTHRDNGSLILHEKDSDDHVFYLVTGALPTYKVVGWIRGEDGKSLRYWRSDTGRPAFFVPQLDLRPLTEQATCGSK